MRHLGLSRSEILSMPIAERDFYYRQLKEEVEKHNRDIAQVETHGQQAPHR